MGNSFLQPRNKHVDNYALVIDIGSLYTKVGIVGDQTIKSFSSRNGASSLYTSKTRDAMVKHEFEQQHSALLSPLDNEGERIPIRRGLIEDSDLFEYLLHGIYSDLQFNPSHHPVIIPVSSCTPKDTKEQLIEIMFEKFCVPSLMIESSALLCLFSQNLQTGLVLESGETSTSIVPIYKCKPIEKAVRELPFAGSHVTLQLLDSIVKNNSNSSNNNLTVATARELKHRCVQVAPSAEEALQDSLVSLSGGR